MSKSFTHCTSCDEVINSDLKKTTPRSSESEGEGSEYLTGRVELNTFRRYLLSHVDRSEVNEVLDLFNRQLPLCSLCMEMISRIYDFENEIDRIKSLIDSMVAFLKGRVLATFGSEARSNGCQEERILKIRTLIAGDLDDLPITDQAPLPNLREEDMSSLLTDIRSSYDRFQDAKPVVKIEVVPDAPSSSIVADKQASVCGEETSANTANNDVDVEWDMPEAGSDNDWSGGDNQEDEDESSSSSSSEDEEDISIDQPNSERPTKRRRWTRTAPGEIPKYKQRKTDRRPRRAKKLSDNTFEFQGHKFSKEENGSYKCGTCSNILKSRDSVTVHIKQSHLGEGSGHYLCETCGKSFTNPNCYRIHLSIHSEVKRYQCHICGHAFRNGANLIQHKKTHGGDNVKYYECDREGCEQRFLRKRQLDRHLLAHTGSRPYICETCGKGFFSPSDLQSHMKTHAGPQARKHICDLCGKDFLTSSHLKRHKVNVHKVDPDSGINNRLAKERTKAAGGSSRKTMPELGLNSRQQKEIKHFLSTELFPDF